MNDASQTPRLDLARALHIAAMGALIDETLAHEHADHRKTQGASLLKMLTNAGLAAVHAKTLTVSLTLYGITATSKAGPHGLLRAWQSAARDRIAGVHGGDFHTPLI
jgi:hypothetical protein